MIINLYLMHLFSVEHADVSSNKSFQTFYDTHNY